MTADQLRKSILQLSNSRKLTKQNSDESAADLLNKLGQKAITNRRNTKLKRWIWLILLYTKTLVIIVII